MSGAFFVLQAIDGFDRTRDHRAGRLPELFAGAGFDPVERYGRLRTGLRRLRPLARPGEPLRVGLPLAVALRHAARAGPVAGGDRRRLVGEEDPLLDVVALGDPALGAAAVEAAVDPVARGGRRGFPGSPTGAACRRRRSTRTSRMPTRS